MPRIAAASIEEHVRVQKARITAAARRQFARRGYHGTEIADVAADVGLARNSLYRYFANKDELLVACIKDDMELHVQRLQQLTQEYADPIDRILAWLDLQFELATGPAHATMELAAEIRDASRPLPAADQYPYEASATGLGDALLELHRGAARAEIQAAMINGAVLAATAHAVSLKKSARREVHAELRASVRAMIKLE